MDEFLGWRLMPVAKDSKTFFFIGQQSQQLHWDLHYKKGIASQSTSYYIQQNLQYATYREKKTKLTASGVTLGYIDRHYRE